MENKKSAIEFLLQDDIQDSLDIEDFEYIYSKIPRSKFLLTSKVTQVMVEELGISLDRILSNLKDIPGYFCYEMQSLTEVDIGSNISSIGEHAFHDCTALKNVTIGNNVTSIGISAFSNCNSLKGIVIPDNVTSTGVWVFEHCTSLESVSISSSMTSINSYMFNGCRSLKSVTVPGNVKVVGDGAFEGCSSLEEVILENGVQQLSRIAFENCAALKEIFIPDSVNSIDRQTFIGCDVRLTIDPNNRDIKIIDGILCSNGGKNLICSIDQRSTDDVIIPDGTTSIGDQFFYEDKTLRSVTLPDSITSIGVSAFEGCVKLTSINLPDGITTIGNYAFNKCKSLTSINMPYGVTRVSGGIFSGCKNLKDIYYSGTASEWASINRVSSFDNPLYYGGQLHLKDGVAKNIRIESIIEIQDFAFYNYVHLESVSLSKEIRAIGVCAFNGCTNLREIQYDGTTSEFKRIIRKNKWCGGIGELIVRCTNGNLSYTQRK